MSENERDPQADLALCEAATPGPWESVSGYSVRETEDERGYGPIIASMDCKEHSIEQMVHNACFICESREALPWYIKAYLEQRKEIERLRAELEQIKESFSNLYDHNEASTIAVARWSEEAREKEEALQAEVERLRAENERLREQSEESALARLRAWVQGDSTYYRHADLSVEGRKDDAGEPSMCLDISWHGGKLSVWNTPLKREMPDTIGIGTEDKPASFGEMVEAALARWAELYGNQ